MSVISITCNTPETEYDCNYDGLTLKEAIAVTAKDYPNFTSMVVVVFPSDLPELIS